MTALAQPVELAPENWKLILSYDGTEFHGWQIQPGELTVQGELQAALGRIAMLVAHGVQPSDIFPVVAEEVAKRLNAIAESLHEVSMGTPVTAVKRVPEGVLVTAGDAALTGPIVRGDVNTVRSHLKEIAASAPGMSSRNRRSSSRGGALAAMSALK